MFERLRFTGRGKNQKQKDDKMKTTPIRAAKLSVNRPKSRQVLECAGRAQRRRRFRTRIQSGVALRLPPQSKRLRSFMVPMCVQSSRRFYVNRCQKRGQPCPREPKSRNARTKLSALLS